MDRRALFLALSCTAFLAFGCDDDILIESPSAEQTDEPALRHLFSGGRPDHPDYAPDGEKIVFIAKRTGQSQVYLSNELGTDAVALTTEAGSNSSPSFSPSGSWVAYASIRSGKWDIWRVATDGSFDEALTDDPGQDRDCQVGPDGTIVFASNRDNDGSEGESFNLWLLDGPGAEPERLTNSDSDDLHPTWSPDLENVVFTRRTRDISEIWSVDVSTRRATRLTSPGLGALDQEPAWSPDGEYVAFSSTRDGSWDLYLLELAEPIGDPMQITDTDFNDRRPRWLPGETTIRGALLFASDRNGESAIWKVWRLIR